MKQPISKLPWTIETHIQHDKKYQKVVHVGDVVNDYDNTVISNETYYPTGAVKEDIECIVQYCNNFPKAIELLKSLGSLPESEVYEFLKSLEDEK